MVISLTNGEVLRPQGKTLVEKYGVIIEVSGGEYVIPYPRIRWVFSGKGMGQIEDDVYKNALRKEGPIKFFGNLTQMSNEELIKGMYD